MTAIPEPALRARQNYADGVTVRAILADTGFDKRELYYWLDGAPQLDGSTLLPALPRRYPPTRPRMGVGRRRSLIARILLNAEQQVGEIELRLGTAAADSERDARALAVLARTLRELTAADALARTKKTAMPAVENGDTTRQRVRARNEPVPRDLEELRRDLSRRLDQLVAESATLPDEPPAGD
jgi:hypothetical protein